MRLNRKFIFLAVGIGLLVATQGVTNAATPKKNYIVIYKDNVTDPDTENQAIAHKQGLKLDYAYRHAFKGFAASIPEAQLKKIKDNPKVAAVTEDRLVQAFGQVTPTGVARVDAPTNKNKGIGVGVAVVDTGIDLTHPELASRIVATKNCVRSERNAKDENGHGTHVAGTVGATDNTAGIVGVAPAVSLIAVKVLNRYGSGTWSSVICGIDWVTQNKALYNIKVANLSLGGSGTSDNNCGLTNNDSLHRALCASTAAGVTYVVAAGNSSTDAATFVPAAYDDTVITVAALADSDGKKGGLGTTTSYGADDTFASFSNYGTVVDLAAPGVNIFSTYKSGSYATLSGTSMAAPHVAGGAALYLATHPTADWTAVKAALIAAAEALGSGHTDPSGLHPEPVVLAGSL